MMISPEYYRSTIENHSLEELIKERDELLEEIRRFEQKRISYEEYCRAPSPDVIYQCNNMYLIEIIDLINQKFNAKIHDYSIAESYQDRYSIVDFGGKYNEQAIRRLEQRPMHVQAYVNNISFPSSLDELEFFIYEHGCFNVEDILQETETEWTAPKWTKIGDIVFFMHAKYAISTITKLRTQLNQEKDFYSDEQFNTMMEWIERGIELHKKYGGKIFAIAQVSGRPTYEVDENIDDAAYHWKSRIYAEMDNVTVLEKPIDISEFNDFIYISRQGAITPVLGNEFDLLKKIIASKNELPSFYREADATPMPLMNIKEHNWFTMTNEYRRAFMLESQFRSYYVNYLLKAISDRKTIWKECRCRKQNMPDSFIDNVIFINGRYLPVEVKLSVAAQNDIKGQVSKYCQDEIIWLDGKEDKRIEATKVYADNCLVIDTDHIFMYQNKTNNLISLYDLDELATLNDVQKLKQIIINNLF